MRKWLIGLVLVALLVAGGLWWLGEQAVRAGPPEGEVRIPVEGVFDR